MLTGIRERTIVNADGKVEIFAPDLAVGTEVEVIVLVDEEMDETEYLLSTEANRKHLEEALKELEHPENFIKVSVEDLENRWKT